MLETTVIAVGPGGVGKTDVDTIFKSPPDVARLDPYRLRCKGHRLDKEDDRVYAPPRLRNELEATLKLLGDPGDVLQELSDEQEAIILFPRAKTLMFTVRKEDWQVLMLAGLEGRWAKGEIYVPVLAKLLGEQIVKTALGEVRVLVLNPSQTRVAEILAADDYEDIEEKTKANCIARLGLEDGEIPSVDQQEAIDKRVKSIREELPYWAEWVKSGAAVEFAGWPYTEAVFKFPAEHGYASRSDVVARAKERLVAVAPFLADMVI